MLSSQGKGNDNVKEQMMQLISWFAWVLIKQEVPIYDRNHYRVIIINPETLYRTHVSKYNNKLVDLMLLNMKKL